MPELDRILSAITRRTSVLRGIPRKIADRLRRHYSAKYRDREDRWAVIDDYDGDLKFKVDRSAYHGSAIYWHRYHSLDEIAAARRLIRPGMVFVDAGANQGPFTLFAAKHVRDGTVLAFEPLESMYRQLVENVEMNGFKNVKTWQMALGDEPGTLDLYGSEDVERYHAFHEGLTTLYKTDYRSVKMGETKVERFDTVFAETGLERLDFFKIDVEGAELPVLRGAQESIERFKPVVALEMNEETFEVAGYKSGDVIDFFEKLGYKTCRIRRRGRLKPIARDEMPGYWDAVFLPPGHD